MRECAERLIPVTFELGGKDSMIILKDADIDFATEAALWGSFFNCGQTCASVERIYIEREILEPFLEKLIGKTKRLKIGIDIGPLKNEKQFSKVKEHLEDALMKGGKIVYQIDFKSEKGLFFPPTIILNLNEEMKCLREETFGPLIRIISVENWKEAIELTNSSNMGLSSSIWTKNIELAKEIAKEIQAGTIWINNLFYSYNATQCPWGGVKESGIEGFTGNTPFTRLSIQNLYLLRRKKRKASSGGSHTMRKS
ncbi:MAG: aldehyde dehydrogenase family protein [Candidatus Aminicenantia bacterium]